MPRPLGPFLVLFSLFALATASAPAASLPAGSTALLTGGPSLFDALPVPVSFSQATRWSVSSDGRFVAFASASDGLVDGDDDRVVNVYVKDRATGAVTLASRATGPAGEPSHVNCNEAAISDDGSKAAFNCRGPLDPADTNTSTDVYVRDLAADTTTLVSRADNLGPVGNGPSYEPALSGTGEYVAFSSEATNIVAGTGGGHHVFRRRLGAGNAVVLVSRRNGAAGLPAGGAEPSISDDGNRIAFTSFDSPGPDPADTNQTADVYLRTVSTSATALISRAAGATGAVGNGLSNAPAIAGNGSAVAFESKANQFDFMDDPDKAFDIYWRSLASNNTALVSRNAAGDKGDT